MLCQQSYHNTRKRGSDVPGSQYTERWTPRHKKNCQTPRKKQKDLAEDVKLYVAGCLWCQKGKPQVGKALGELHPTPMPPGPWSHIGWDLVRPITESAGKNAILCITDLFSKAIKLEAITTKITAKGVARIFRG